ncbi:class I SAM-dependent methyltransferase [Chryseolinea lacunae]|uniref:Class I SAM-dependent methyltransferase n=1 Tax=Chryseolinea lacunae TaxID=2801331 RepID=A0ABS1KZ18_9BACT|nr:class I SAM-dependent methyltransferase [Chryseolinea lacunae]MBL0743571.1 class I SAM-dependent methyltransferase [Chryseolinea lacunae]
MKAVSKTAYYCCGVRMQDAESKHPIVGDRYARALLGADGLRYWEDFRKFKFPNASCIARHYIIDEHVRAVLKQKPDATFVLVGAGLDSRAFRFRSGTWLEFDAPEVMQYKNNILPQQECPNSLQRVAIDFEREKLRDKLAPYATAEHVTVIVEGVLIYLTRDQKRELIAALTTIFPHHTLLCDLMTAEFFEKAGRKFHSKIVAAGTTFLDIAARPEQIFLDHHYTEKARESNMITAVRKGVVYMPKFLAERVFKRLFMGYAVYTFDFTQKN